MVRDEIKAAEQRGYSKGYAAGKKRRVRDLDTLARYRVLNAAFNRAFIAALPAESRGVVDEVAERRALNKALDALDALSERWATEIGLDAMCANLAKAEDVPAAIHAMAVQAWVEGAYAGRTSHQAAALPAVREGWVSVSERLPEEGVLVLVYVPDAGDGERFDQDYIEDGAWAIHNEHREHYLAVGGPAAAGADVVCTGPSEDAPYTHWKPLRAPAATPAHDQPEGEG